MNLRNLQEDFQGMMLDAECTGAGWIDSSVHGLSASARMGIYHNAYRVRLIDVLLDTFEHTAIYLGDDWFRQLALNYVQTHCSTQANIGFYGQAFPGFLSRELAGDREIPELAIMDWTLRRAFDGEDAAAMTSNDLQQLAGGTCAETRLQPVPTLKLVTQAYNTLDIWHAINTGEIPPEAERLREPLDVMVWRKGHSPHFRSVSKFEVCALDCLSAASTLDSVGATLEKAFPDDDVATEFGVVLQRWIEDQVIQAL